MAQQYLEERAAGGLSQKQRDADRNALEFITGRAAPVPIKSAIAPHNRPNPIPAGGLLCRHVLNRYAVREVS
jgi:hypothetical protein